MRDVSFLLEPRNCDELSRVITFLTIRVSAAILPLPSQGRGTITMGWKHLRTTIMAGTGVALSSSLLFSSFTE